MREREGEVREARSARPHHFDESFVHWLVRRSRAVLRQVLIADVVDMWEKISVVDEKRSLTHVVPFGWQFIILPIATCTLHFVCLLLHRCWEGMYIKSPDMVVSYCMLTFKNFYRRLERRDRHHVDGCCSPDKRQLHYLPGEWGAVRQPLRGLAKFWPYQCY